MVGSVSSNRCDCPPVGWTLSAIRDQLATVNHYCTFRIFCVFLFMIIVHRHCNWLGMNAGSFSSLEDSVAPSSVKASPQRGSSQVRFSSDPMGFRPKVHGVFSNMELPSPSRKYPRAK